ncbi:MAG: hypothetical protein IPO43_19980 [Rhodoferax sp.]|nr:hypothetical protein [Rhodoferax sp.]
MKLEQIDPFVSLATSIPPENRVERQAYTQLASLAPPPHGAPASLASVRGLLTCIERALVTIPSPSAQALTISDSFVALQRELEGTLTATGAAESLGGVDRTKTRHPEWHFLVRIGSKRNVHRLATLYVGLKSLLAIRAAKSLSRSTIDNAEKLLKEDDLTEVQVHALLHGTSPEQILGQSWPRDLCRAWRDVTRHFCMDGDPPPASTKERIAAQILDAALHATTGVRAGARSHRQFSKSQLCKTFARVGVAQDQDTLLGALGVLVCLTTFSVDVVAELPLKSRSLDGSWLAEIDVQCGTVAVDYGFVTHEAAAPIAGAIPSSYICTRPLPTTLADHLRARLERYPDARALKELFPEEGVPAHDSLVFPCTDQIQPTWARLRRSTGTYLRESGVDNLLASVPVAT